MSTHRDIEHVLLSCGPFATGTGGFGTPADPEVVASVAADWASAGFTAAQVDEWLGARVFTPEAARALLEREIFPAQASRLSGPDQGLGQYEDTVGYKLANNDLTSAEADEIVRRLVMADDVQMSAAHAAEHLGLKVGTLHAYRRDGLMPSADGMIGRTPWWWQSTIDTWWESRPGRGTGGGRPRRGQRVRAKSSDETPG